MGCVSCAGAVTWGTALVAPAAADQAGTMLHAVQLVVFPFDIFHFQVLDFYFILGATSCIHSWF